MQQIKIIKLRSAKCILPKKTIQKQIFFHKKYIIIKPFWSHLANKNYACYSSKFYNAINKDNSKILTTNELE